MNVLIINCGSSTLKFKVMETRHDTPSCHERILAGGIIDRIGGQGEIRFKTEDGEDLREVREVKDYEIASDIMFDWIESIGLMKPGGIEAVGHRVVHGGYRFVEPAIIDDEVIDAIEAMRNIAPLHNDPSLKAIRSARARLGPHFPMVAVFDTAFHCNMPESASRYAIPIELADKHRIRRYGFHGLAHRFMAERYAIITERPLKELRLVTLQLGNGCSATAIDGGRSVDTSMGFTPLEGLMMGTRSGDVDPHLPGFLARHEGVDIEEVEDWLNRRSGLLGVSGHSNDMRELLGKKSKGDLRASLAVEIFCYRAKKQIGAYFAAIGGADAVIFGGGIGENSPEVRARICAGMEWCGLALDEDINAGTIGSENRISKDSARIHVYVIPVDEEAVIVRDTVLCLHIINRHLRR
ncbi:MAG: acetate kinase [Nitrospinae bacterium]|nr:acetate kinase [Nitrospinota bacterium]